MLVVKFNGGLGNQMFQVAFAIALKEKFPNEEVMIDTQLFRFPIIKSFRGVNFYHNGYEVEKFFPKASLPIAILVVIGVSDRYCMVPPMVRFLLNS